MPKRAKVTDRERPSPSPLFRVRNKLFKDVQMRDPLHIVTIYGLCVRVVISLATTNGHQRFFQSTTTPLPALGYFDCPHPSGT